MVIWMTGYRLKRLKPLGDRLRFPGVQGDAALTFTPVTHSLIVPDTGDSRGNASIQMGTQLRTSTNDYPDSDLNEINGLLSEKKPAALMLVCDQPE